MLEFKCKERIGDAHSLALALFSLLRPALIQQLILLKHCVLRCLRQAAVMIFPPPPSPPSQRAIDQTSTSSSTLAATLCAHVGKCKRWAECVASSGSDSDSDRPLLGQAMLPALTLDANTDSDSNADCDSRL